LPGAQVTGCLVEVNDLPAILAGFDPLRRLAHGTAKQLVGFGVMEVGKTDCMGLLAHGGGNDLYPVLPGFFHIVIAQGKGKHKVCPYG